MRYLYIIGRLDGRGRPHPRVMASLKRHPGEVNRWLSDYNAETVLEMESQRSGVPVSELYIIHQERRAS